MKVYIGNKDLTKYVIDDSYSVDSIPIYSEWIDSNKKIHRVETRRQVQGEFKLLLRQGWTMTDTEFLNLMEANTEDFLLTLTVWVENLAKLEAIRAYATVTTDEMLDKGQRITVYTVTIEEA